MTELRRADRLRMLLRRRGIRRGREAFFAIAVALLAIGIPLFVVPRSVKWWQVRRDAAASASRDVAPKSAIEFPDRAGAPLAIAADRWEDIGLILAKVTDSPPAPPLKIDGVLYLDPDDYGLVRSRFQGEIVEMPNALPNAVPNTEATSSASHDSALHDFAHDSHTLRFGDEVKKGQLLAVVWSRELGEKKSELAEVLSTLAFDRETLSRLSNNQAAVPINSIREAERRVRANEIAVDRIEKTLSSWQLSAQEIQEIRSELIREKDNAPDGKREIAHKSVDEWARVEIRSPIDGTIVEKNVTVGTLVDLDDALFKIANLTHLDVRAFAYEEDLATLQRLTVEQRQWTIQLKGDAESKPIKGVFDRIGSLIDPLQHTGLVMGWVDNADRTLRAGQFVNAAVTLPDSQKLLSVPAHAVVDVDGDTFVLLQQAVADQFLPVQVKVVRFQENLACIDPRGRESCPDCIVAGDHVVAAGAVEILAEYQSHLKTNAPSEPAAKAKTLELIPQALFGETNQ